MLQAVNVPLNGNQIDKLIDMLDRDGDGEIDYSWDGSRDWDMSHDVGTQCLLLLFRELIDGDREYKRSQLRKKMKELEVLRKHLTKPETKPIIDKNNPFS